MKKLTVDLDILTNHSLSFDQYLVLHHIHTGEFQSDDNEWFMFDETVFAELYLTLKKPGVGPVLLSLKHRKLIELKPSGLFRCVNKNLFNTKKSRKKNDTTIFSFRKENSVSVSTSKNIPMLKRSTKLEHFQSEEFKKAAADFQKMRAEKGQPLTESKAERLAARLIRLSENNEQTAIAILRESWENSYTGIFPLKNAQAVPPPPAQDRRTNVDQWYQKPANP